MKESELSKQMLKIAHHYQQTQMQSVEQSRLKKHAQQRLTQEIMTVLNQFATDVTQIDESLTCENLPDGSVGLMISYNKQTQSIHPSFLISVTIQTETIEVLVTDGHWEQVPGTLGAWADWTSQHTVYAGSPDLMRMRKSIEPMFLRWYEAAMNMPDDPPE